MQQIRIYDSRSDEQNWDHSIYDFGWIIKYFYINFSHQWNKGNDNFLIVFIT